MTGLWALAIFAVWLLLVAALVALVAGGKP